MISVELTKRFKKIVRNAGREREVLDALKLVCEGFGNPHLHSGLSIRKLDKQLYECRTSLNWRLVFEADKNILLFDFAGDHDEVQNYLRGKR
jgi:mRNA-degrading endonuclease YafQ of YafQ-DinJ toxin-antitoxin module